MKPKNRQFKFLIPLVWSLLFAASALAADVQMTIEPQMISLMDRAVLKVEFIGTKGDAIDIPRIEGLRIQYRGKSSETRIVNRRRTSKIVHTYIVTPSKVGDYTIGPVLCNFKGGQKEVSAKLRVIKPKNDKEAQEISEIMFSRISSSREAPYVHEPFDLEVKVYVRDGVQIDESFSLRGGMPENGMEGDLDWTVTGRKRELVDGTIFNVYVLRTMAKTLTAGTFIFEPQIQVKIIIPRQNRRSFGFDDPFFGDFFGRQETRPVVLDCNKLEIPVQPVPVKGRPASFTGGIGRFGFDVSVGPEKVKEGEPITIKTRIRGKGNLSQITPPKLPDSSDFKQYEARILPSENPDELIFEQVVIPKTDEVKEIPPIAFSYFNTQTADFRTLKKGPFPITVEAVPQQAAQVIARLPSQTVKPDTQVIGRDIIYLKPAPSRWIKPTVATSAKTKQNVILLSLPALLLALVTGFSARRNKLAGNVALARRHKALKTAVRSLDRAESALRKKDNSAFYEALWTAMTDYFGHRLNLAPGEVTLQTVQDRLPQKVDLNETLEMLFSTIEQRRYGLGADADSKAEKKKLHHQLFNTLKKCERIKL